MDYSPEQRDYILSKAYERGFFYEKVYRGCAQAVVGAVGEIFNLDETAFKVAAGFSGGIADEARGTCGAFSGCIIVLGYFFGRDLEHITTSGSKFKCRELVRGLRRKFHDTYGGENCWQIQKSVFGGKYYNMGEPAEKVLFEEAGAHKDKCTTVAGNAAKWLAEILLNEGISVQEE